jgi:putative glutathione S-transferase
MAKGEQLIKEIGAKGSFERQKNSFTTPFGNGGGELPVEAGRYRLIWAKVCPWATRQAIARSILGLEDVISIGTVDPIRPESVQSDWSFTLDPGNVDPVLKIHFLSEAYKKADPDYQGRCTVPAVVEVSTGKVVNNDYFNLTYYWEKQWKPFHKPGAPDLLPDEIREDIFALNDVIFRDVNNGVYRAGFARSQEAYEKAYNDVFNRLDELEERLGGRRFLFGDQITDSDLRLYVTLIRFDAAYYSVFRCNKKRIRDYPNLWRYTRELYAVPAFGENTDFDHIKRHYHICCDPGNIYKITPKGPDEQEWIA